MYGPQRYKDICKERYIISKHTNTSYGDTKNITPTERKLLIEFIVEDLKKQQELIDQQEQK